MNPYLATIRSLGFETGQAAEPMMAAK